MPMLKAQYAHLEGCSLAAQVLPYMDRSTTIRARGPSKR